MNCERARHRLYCWSVGDVEPEEEPLLESHLSGCPDCQRLRMESSRMIEALSDAALYHPAPARLRERIIQLVEEKKTDEVPAPQPRSWWLSWPALAAAGSLAILLVTMSVFQPRSGSDLLAREVVSSHVRSLMADHLTDVPSSDKHTVKPWFDGRIDFAPQVPDLGGQGFSLIGGRLDYVAGRPAAALVYQRRQHTVNLFIFRGETSELGARVVPELQGYNIFEWNKDGMEYWAVSDLNPEELKQFALLYQN